MALIDSLLNRFGYGKKAVNVPPFLYPVAESQSYTLPNFNTVEYQMNMYKNISWIFAGISNVANTASGVKFNVNQKNGEEQTDIPNHVFENLLDNPNPLDSREDLIYNTAAFYKITGNAYWWLNIIGGRPIEIWPLEPDKLFPIPDGRMYLKGYNYYPGNGLEIPIPEEEIVHFKKFNPYNRFVGMSDLMSPAVSAHSDYEMVKWNDRVFGKSNGKLPGVLAFKDQISDIEWAEIKREIRQTAEKRDFLMLRSVGDAVNYINTSTTQKEMDYLGQREFARDEIWSVIAPGLASMLAVNATEANSMAGKNTFLEMAVYPVLEQIASKITRKILPFYGKNLVGQFEDVRVIDREIKMREEELYSRSHTLAELRKEFYGDDPLNDERDNLLVVQISATSGVEQPEPVIEPTGQATQTGFTEQVPQSDTIGDTIDEPDEVETDMKAFERKAIKALKNGKSAAVKFESQHIDGVKIAAFQGMLETAEDLHAVNTFLVLPAWSIHNANT